MVKSWLVQDQTVSALTIPGQTTTGKESSNPFMAGSFPKTISPMIHLSRNYTLRCEEDSLKLIELMHLCTKLINKVTILENDSKETYDQTLTMLMKKVKRLEDKLKFYNTSKKTRMVISDAKEYLISEDSIKQGRIIEDCR
ncbi:hypothetical protein Tco_0385058 [Tanacetum coccineum]